MASQPLVEYQYTLVPKGETISSANERRMERVVDTVDKSYASESVARKALKRNNKVDAYALRKYWDVVRLDVQFANKPWNSWGGLEDDMMTLDEAVVFVKTRTLEGIPTVFISTEDGEEERIAEKILDYYNILNPIVETGQITICPDAPLLEIEEQFRENQK